jgi:hypothetical protein
MSLDELVQEQNTYLFKRDKSERDHARAESELAAAVNRETVTRRDRILFEVLATAYPKILLAQAERKKFAVIMSLNAKLGTPSEDENAVADLVSVEFRRLGLALRRARVEVSTPWYEECLVFDV